jgi:hypothetical protein
MKVISITTHNDRLIAGYVDDGRNYRRFQLRPNNELSFGPDMPKSDYRGLEHFAGVIGKFNPYTFVLVESIAVERMEFNELAELLAKDDRFKGGETP